MLAVQVVSIPPLNLCTAAGISLQALGIQKRKRGDGVKHVGSRAGDIGGVGGGKGWEGGMVRSEGFIMFLIRRATVAEHKQCSAMISA